MSGNKRKSKSPTASVVAYSPAYADLLAAEGVRDPRSLSSHHLRNVLRGILDWAIDVTDADFGNIQLIAPGNSHLHIAVQRGFKRPFLNFFTAVKHDGSACAKALNSAQRMIVPNVRKSAVFTEPSRRVMLNANAHAVQSTPLVRPSGDVVGMISTHFRQPYRPTREQMLRMDLIAGHTVTLLNGSSHPELAPPCPKCQSVSTIRVDERVGEWTFFCTDCEQSWVQSLT